jgi:Holliday junction resolvasome RuvABC endonuclease subunit
MHLLGVDPSVTATGLVLISTDEGYISTKVLHSTEHRGIVRLQLLAESFDSFLETYTPDMAVIEGYVRGSFSVITNVEIGILLRMKLHERNIPWYVCPPTVLKKFVAGTGRAKKPDMAIAVKDRWGFVSPSDDVVDAYGLAKIAELVAQSGVSALKGIVRG